MRNSELSLFVFFAPGARSRLIFMEKRHAFCASLPRRSRWLDAQLNNRSHTMNAKFLAAAALLVASTSAFAADGAVASTAAGSAAVSASAQALNLPSVTVPASRSRAEVHAEAVDFVAHYKTMLEVQLELAKN
jgi:hypothetical protein